MFGNIPTRDLPAIVGIIACAVVERVVESRWLRWVAAVVAVGVLGALVVGG